MCISVIIPVYNAEKYIVRCLDSLVKAKSNLPIEILIVNDGSTDNSRRLCEDMAGMYPFIQVITQKNLGPSMARNKGLAIAKRDYIVFVDADDYVESSYLEVLYNSISYNKSDLACCGYLDETLQGVERRSNYDRDFFYEVSDFIPYVLKNVGGVLWDKIFKRDILLQNDIWFNTDFNISEDLLFILSYLRFVNSVSIVKSNLYHYNQINTNGLSKRLNFEQFKMIKSVNEVVLEKIKYFHVNQDLVYGLLSMRLQRYLIEYGYQISLDTSSYKLKIERLAFLKRDMIVGDVYSWKELRSFEYPLVFFFRSHLFTYFIIYCKILAVLRILYKSLNFPKIRTGN